MLQHRNQFTISEISRRLISAFTIPFMAGILRRRATPSLKKTMMTWSLLSFSFHGSVLEMPPEQQSRYQHDLSSVKQTNPRSVSVRPLTIQRPTQAKDCGTAGRLCQPQSSAPVKKGISFSWLEPNSRMRCIMLHAIGSSVSTSIVTREI